MGLPKTNAEEYTTREIPVPAEEDEKKKIKFKEKTVSSLVATKGTGGVLKSSGEAGFKKRKVGPGAKNLRNREEDE